MKFNYAIALLILKPAVADRATCTSGLYAGLAPLTLLPGVLSYCSSAHPVPTVTSTIPTSTTVTAPTSTATVDTVGTSTAYSYTTTVTATIVSGAAKRDVPAPATLLKRVPEPVVAPTSVEKVDVVCQTQRTTTSAIDLEKQSLKKRQVSKKPPSSTASTSAPAVSSIAPVLSAIFALPGNVASTFCSCAQTITPTTSITSTSTSTFVPMTTTTVTTSVTTVTVQTATTSYVVMPQYCSNDQFNACGDCNCNIIVGTYTAQCNGYSEGQTCTSSSQCPGDFPYCVYTIGGPNYCSNNCNPSSSKRSLEELFNRHLARSEKSSRREIVAADSAT